VVAGHYTLCPWERHLMLFPTLRSKQSTHCGASSLTKDMQTEQLLCWKGMTYTEHSKTSSLNEERNAQNEESNGQQSILIYGTVYSSNLI